MKFVTGTTLASSEVLPRFALLLVKSTAQTIPAGYIPEADI